MMTYILFLLGCTGQPQATATEPRCHTSWYADADRDGFGDPGAAITACSADETHVADASDCDDTDPSTHPGAAETCDEPLDHNCDGSVGYADADDDGVAACMDCDDRDPGRYPGAVERCDGVDQDCDGLTDDDAVDATRVHPDADGDGYGDGDSEVWRCDTAGYTLDFSDCDDADPAVHPGAVETCDALDRDCDGSPDAGAEDAAAWYADADGDGYGAGRSTTACERPESLVDNALDCDDTDANTSPGADEVCDGGDEDCDGAVDEADASDAPTWYRDADGDGHGDPDVSLAACSSPAGYVADATDCDDTDPSVSPDAPEVCGGADEDCDGAVDEDGASDAATWFADLDGDGYGDPGSAVVACEAPSDHVADDTDCDDTDASASPAGTEDCGGGDEDCDGTVDEDDALDAPAWFRDADGDGLGDPRIAHDACAAPAGFVADDSDCDDADATEGAASTWYADADGDGYGDATTPHRACSAPAGTVLSASDCDDADPSVHPGAPESDCDDPTDYNCDGSVGSADLDGDGFTACEDCDDAAAALNPLAAETCDGLDDDCDGVADGADALDASEWYPDADEDGFGDEDGGFVGCEPASGHVAVGGDCDGGDAEISPDAEERCATTADDDCDGSLDAGAADCTDWYLDLDGDGAGSSTSWCGCVADAPYTATDDEDCDDGDATVSPEVEEVLGNGVDDDCDGLVDQRTVYEGELIVYAGSDDAQAGWGLAGGEDLDGDGLDDIALAAMGDQTGGVDAGLVAVVSGTRTGAVDILDADARYWGEDDEDEAGIPVVGDVDGDGVGDLLVGVAEADGGGTERGSVYLMFGPLSGDQSLGRADTIFGGTDDESLAGWDVALPGDVDGDGIGEILVGAPGVQPLGTDEGAVFLLSGNAASGPAETVASATLYGGYADWLGELVGSPGDTDGDGLADLLVGAPSHDGSGVSSGEVYLLEAAPTGTALAANLADATWEGEGPFAGDGMSVRGHADIDGDGYTDLMFGAPQVPTNGRAYIDFGPFSGVSRLDTVDLVIDGLVANGRFGIRVVSPGDLDEDGLGELLVGDNGDDTYGSWAGRAWLFMGLGAGSYDTSSATANWTGAPSDDVGADFALSDVDGDGTSEVLFGAPGSGYAADEGGLVSVIRPF